MEIKSFLNALENDKIVQAIALAESECSGQVRVFISHKKVSDAVSEAQQTFTRLGMQKTEHRNAVLLFFAPKSNSFAVIGDEGIHNLCGNTFWSQVAASMTELLKQGQFTNAILIGIKTCGELLSKHFPPNQNQKNELPNKVEEDTL